MNEESVDLDKEFESVFTCEHSWLFVGSTDVTGRETGDIGGLDNSLGATSSSSLCKFKPKSNVLFFSQKDVRFSDIFLFIPIDDKMFLRSS